MMRKDKTKIRALVADDIAEVLQMICKMIKELDPIIEIVGAYTSLEETDRAIRQLKPDVLFLDIQFDHEGSTAFDLLERTKREGYHDFQTVIITSHFEKQYYSKAFEYKAIHFVEKPIDREQLREAIERIKQQLMPTSQRKKETIKSNPCDHIVLKNVHGSHLIELEKIVYLLSANKGTVILLADKGEVRSSRNIGYFEEQLKGCRQFVRIHNQILLNLSYMTGVSSLADRMIKLKDPFGNLQCSRDKIRLLRAELKSRSIVI